jgi:hypothetical protein
MYGQPDITAEIKSKKDLNGWDMWQEWNGQKSF